MFCLKFYWSYDLVIQLKTILYFDCQEHLSFGWSPWLKKKKKKSYTHLNSVISIFHSWHQNIPLLYLALSSFVFPAYFLCHPIMTSYACVVNYSFVMSSLIPLHNQRTPATFPLISLFCQCSSEFFFFSQRLLKISSTFCCVLVWCPDYPSDWNWILVGFC